MSNSFRAPKSRRAALAGGAALVLTAAAAHAVAAQQAAAGVEATANFDAPTTDGQDVFLFTDSAAPDLSKRRDEWLKAVAGKLGVSTDELDQAIQDATREIGLPPPLIAPFGKPGVAGVPGGFNIRVGSPFAAAAKLLNITEEQLRKEQQAGKSLTDIARAHNADPKAVADALKAQRKSEIDKAVADGVMPRATGDRIKARIDDEIDHLMEAVPNVSADGRGVSIRLEWSAAP